MFQTRRQSKIHSLPTDAMFTATLSSQFSLQVLQSVKMLRINSSIIMPGAVIEDGAEVQFAIIAENTVVGKNAKVGQNPEETENIDDWGITVVGANTVIKENTVIKAKTMIDSDTEVDGNEKVIMYSVSSLRQHLTTKSPSLHLQEQLQAFRLAENTELSTLTFQICQTQVSAM